MALNIKNEEVETLLNRVTRATGESKTEAVRKALRDRLEKVNRDSAEANARTRRLSFLETELWPQIPENLLGTKLTKDEEEAILGFGEHGV